MYVQLNPRVSQLHWQETLQHSCRLLLEVNPRMSASYLYLPERSQHRCRLLLYKHAYSYAYLCCDTHWSRDIDAEDDQRFHSTTSSLLRVDRSGCYHKRGVILGWDFLRFQLCHIYCTTKLTLPSLQYQPEFLYTKETFLELHYLGSCFSVLFQPGEVGQDGCTIFIAAHNSIPSVHMAGLSQCIKLDSNHVSICLPGRLPLNPT